MLDPSLPPVVTLVAKRDPRSKQPGYVVRSKQNITQEEGTPGFVLDDIDTKGMPDAVKGRLADVGGVAGALDTICPGFPNPSGLDQRRPRQSEDWGASPGIGRAAYLFAGPRCRRRQTLPLHYA